MKTNDEELFRKVYIRSEADLPKESGAILSCSRQGHIAYRRCVPNEHRKANTYENISGSWWLDNIDWYLLPLTPQK